MRELEAHERRSYVQWCDLYALLCNLLGGGKKTWKREDFLSDDGQKKVPPAEVQAALQKYEVEVAKKREEYRKRKSAE